MRVTEDFFPTPHELCDATMHSGAIQNFTSIITALDPGCGYGAWGLALKRVAPWIHLTGVDKYQNFHPPVYNSWLQHDYLRMSTKDKYDLIIGNPPYSQDEDFVLHALEMLNPGGQLVFLLRLAFLEGASRYVDIWQAHKPKEVHVCVNRVYGFHDTHAVFKWVNEDPPTIQPYLYWLNWR